MHRLISTLHPMRLNGLIDLHEIRWARRSRLHALTPDISSIVASPLSRRHCGKTWVGMGKSFLMGRHHGQTNGRTGLFSRPDTLANQINPFFFEKRTNCL